MTPRGGPAYNKVLVARDSHENGCLGPPGEWLVPATSQDSPRERLGADAHFFVTIRGRVPNAFGWVVELQDAITAGALADLDRAGLRARLGDDAPLSRPPLEWYEVYLKAVSGQAAGVPMASSWRHVRGPGVNRDEVTVHRVFFYPGG